MKKIFFLLFLPFIFSSCLEEIEFDIPDDQRDKIAIQGKLLKGNPSIVEITVTSLFDFDGVNNPNRQAGAVVTLHRRNGQQIEIPYFIPRLSHYLEIEVDNPDFEIEENKEYQLRVELADSRKYESDWEMLLPTPNPNKIEIDVVQKQGFGNANTVEIQDYLEVYINTPLKANGASENQYFFWEKEGVHRLTGGLSSPDTSKICYVNHSISNDKLLLANGKTISGDSASIFLFDTRIDYRFAQGYYLTLYQQAMTQNAFEYFEKIDELIDRDATIFQTPAGRVRGNIFSSVPSEEVFGFFYVAQSDTIRLFIEPQDVGSPALFCPPEVIPMAETFDNYPCVDCLFALNSTLIKPDYWVE